MHKASEYKILRNLSRFEIERCFIAIKSNMNQETKTRFYL